MLGKHHVAPETIVQCVPLSSVGIQSSLRFPQYVRHSRESSCSAFLGAPFSRSAGGTGRSPTGVPVAPRSLCASSPPSRATARSAAVPREGPTSAPWRRRRSSLVSVTLSGVGAARASPRGDLFRLPKRFSADEILRPVPNDRHQPSGESIRDSGTRRADPDATRNASCAASSASSCLPTTDRRNRVRGPLIPLHQSAEGDLVALSRPANQITVRRHFPLLSRHGSVAAC